MAVDIEGGQTLDMANTVTKRTFSFRSAVRSWNQVSSDMNMAESLYDSYFRPWGNANTELENRKQLLLPDTKPIALDLSTKSPQKTKKKPKSYKSAKVAVKDRELQTSAGGQLRNHALKNIPLAVTPPPQNITPDSCRPVLQWNPFTLQNPMVLQQIQAYYQFVNTIPLMQLQQAQNQQRLLEQEKLELKCKSLSSPTLKQVGDTHSTASSPMLSSVPTTPTLKQHSNFEMEYNQLKHLKSNSRDVQQTELLSIPQLNTSNDESNKQMHHYPLPTAKDGEPLDLLPKSLYMNRAHGGHLCIFCGKLYSRKYGLKIHLRTHTGYKPLKCKICQRPFGDPSNLNKHIRLHAEGDTPYRCNYCGKVLVRRRDLERHIRSRHPGHVDACADLLPTGGSPRCEDLDESKDSCEADFENIEELDVVGY